MVLNALWLIGKTMVVTTASVAVYVHLSTAVAVAPYTYMHIYIYIVVSQQFTEKPFISFSSSLPEMHLCIKFWPLFIQISVISHVGFSVHIWFLFSYNLLFYWSFYLPIIITWIGCILLLLTVVCYCTFRNKSMVLCIFFNETTASLQII